MQRNNEMEEVPVEPAYTWSCPRICQPDFCQSIFTVKDMFLPVSWKKALWFGGLAVALGGVIATEVTTHAFSTAATYNNYAMMAVLYAVDPLMQLLFISTAKYPPPILSPDEKLTDIEAQQRANADVAIVIPTHCAANIIEATVRSCLQHVSAEQISILDNGNSDTPLDNTREVVRQVDRRIHYYWGHIGNKTFAQYIGARLAKQYQYIFTIDHDMRLPRLFSFETHLINHRVKAVSYPIRAVHPAEGETNILVRWQDIEYLLAGCAKQSQARFGGVLFPHGAVSMWERETFIKVLLQHDAVFFAEDVKLGMILKEMGYSMAIAGSAYLDTVVPETMFNNKPNFYEQRVRSWEMGRQRYTLKFLKQLFLVMPPTNNILDIIIYKIYEFYAVYTNLVDWWRLPMFILMARYPDYWIRMAIIIPASNIPLLLWNYIKLPIAGRKDLQCHLLDILTYPLFKLIESALSVGGVARLMSVVIPNYAPKPTVEEHELSMRQDKVKLLEEVRALEAQVDAPITYKRITYDRFFKPALTYDEIGEEFDYASFYVP